MNFKKKINHYRRKVMRRLTKGIGKGSLEHLKKDEDFKLKKILVNRPNQRLGNMLLVTPLIQEVINHYPDVKIDLFVKGKVAPIVFENYPQINSIIELPKKPFKELIKYIKIWFRIRKEKYDLVINIDKGSSSGRLSTSFARSKYKLFGDEFLTDITQEIQLHHAQYPIYQFREFITLLGKTDIRKELIPSLNIILNTTEVENGRKILNHIIPDSNKKTLGFFTYATGEKCYSEEWWSKFYQLFFEKYSKRYNLIEILPVENISMLKHKLTEYYSKDVREIAAVMQNCEIVIAADSGMMHLSCAAPTKTIGLFKSENFLERYKPYGKDNSVVLVKDNQQEKVIQEMEKLLS